MNKITNVALAALALVSIANLSAAWKVTNALDKKVCVTLKVSTQEIKKAIGLGKQVTFEPTEKWLAKVCPSTITVHDFKEGCPKELKGIGKVTTLTLKKTKFSALQTAAIQKKDLTKQIDDATKKGTPITGKLCGYKNFVLIKKDEKVYAITTK